MEANKITSINQLPGGINVRLAQLAPVQDFESGCEVRFSPTCQVHFIRLTTYGEDLAFVNGVQVELDTFAGFPFAQETYAALMALGFLVE